MHYMLVKNILHVVHGPLLVAVPLPRIAGSAGSVALNFISRPHSGYRTVQWTVWSVMQENVYQHRIKDAGQLHECIVSAWDELDQRMINTEVRQMRTRLNACFKAKGGYFGVKHSLSLP